MESKIQIKIKKVHPDAVIPTQAFKTDAGYDLVAIDDGKNVVINDLNGHCLYIEYDTGLQLEIPTGYHVEIYPRSSISKTHLFLANSLGLIDNDYRGNLKLRFRLIPNSELFNKFWREKQNDGEIYKKGDAIGQLVIKKTNYAEFIEVDELSTSERGTGGFGSSNKSS